MAAAVCRLASAVVCRCQAAETATPSGTGRVEADVRVGRRLVAPVTVSARSQRRGGVRVQAALGELGDDTDDSDEDALGHESLDLDDAEIEAAEIEGLLGRDAPEGSVDDVLGQIGMKTVMSAPQDAGEEDDLFAYPDLPQRRITFGDLLRKAHYGEDVVEQYASVAHIEITGIQHDSRRVRPGELFICVEGDKFNGHWFLPEAAKNGAVLAIARVALPQTATLDLTEEEAAIDAAANPELAELAAEQEEEEEGDEVLDYAAYDDAMMQAAAEEMQKLEDTFGEDPDNAELVAKLSARIASEALETDIKALGNLPAGHEALKELTPHPLNPLVPVEAPIPVIFAQDPKDFAGALAAALYDFPSERMTTVAVTGTNGKTTISWLMRSIFEELGQLTGILGTVEWALATDRLDETGEIWEPMEVDTTLERESSSPFWGAPYQGKYSVPCTTPDQIHVQRLMAGMADRGATACIMEASSIGLDQGRCDEVDVDVAIFTNLTHDHLDYHITMKEYKQAKAKLFHGLTNPERQRGIVNLDDPEAQYFADAASGVPVVTYSVSNPDADVYCQGTPKYTVWDTDMIVTTPLSKNGIQIITPLVGRHNVSNVLACIAAGIAINLPLDVIRNGIEAAENVPGRFEQIDEGQDFAVIVDYAHTPDALSVLLDTVREVGARRVITVFGCGGERDESKRAYMGEVAHYKSDIVILTNDNPRREAPDAIIQGIVAGFPESITDKYPGSMYNYLSDIGRVHETFETELMERCSATKRYVVEDRFCAIRVAIACAQKGDVVVIAGKGHEDYQEHADVNGTTFKSWFDDRVEARNALSKLQYLAQIPYLVRKDTMWTTR